LTSFFLFPDREKTNTRDFRPPFSPGFCPWPCSRGRFFPDETERTAVAKRPTRSAQQRRVPPCRCVRREPQKTGQTNAVQTEIHGYMHTNKVNGETQHTTKPLRNRVSPAETATSAQSWERSRTGAAPAEACRADRRPRRGGVVGGGCDFDLAARA